MTLTDYQIQAKRTCPSLGSKEVDILHMKRGVFTECAEIIDALKKRDAYGKTLDIVNIIEEIGDLCWYVTNWCTFENQTFKARGSVWVIEKTEQDVDFLIDRIIVESKEDVVDFDDIVDRIYDLCKVFYVELEHCLEKNIEKLKIRYPEKFDAEKALNRNLEAEYKVLQ